MKTILFIVLAMISIQQQVFALTATPSPSITWKELNNKNFTLIYPEDAKEEAQRTMNLLNYYFQKNTNSLEAPEDYHTTVVLHTHTMESNGFVDPVNYHSGFYSNPINIDNLDFMESLAVHEGRHMIQMHQLTKTGVKRFLGWLQGGSAKGLISLIFIPNWFFEGDATLMETALTKGGRGRVPAFDMWHRAMELENKRYSYYRTMLGNLNDDYPYADHYKLGYFLNSYVRRKFGPDAWGKALEKTGGYIVFPSFDRALEQVTGEDYHDIYNGALNELKTIWKNQLQDVKLTSTTELKTPENDYWTSFVAPFEFENKIYSFRMGKEYTTDLVTLENGEEKVVTAFPTSASATMLGIFERTFDIQKGNITWVQEEPDIRWPGQSHKNIFSYNIKTGNKERYSSGGRYTSAALSPNLKDIAAFEHHEDRSSTLAILDFKTKEKRKTIPISSVENPLDIQWVSDSEIVYSVLSVKGTRLEKLNLETQQKTILVKDNFVTYRHPSIHNNILYYQSDVSGIDNIYALDLATQKAYQVVSHKYGVFFPKLSSDHSKLYFNNYTTKGHKVSYVSLDQNNWTPMKSVPIKRTEYFKPVQLQEEAYTKNKNAVLKNETFESSNYHVWKDWFNIHSWSFGYSEQKLTTSLTFNDYLASSGGSFSYNRDFKNELNDFGLNWSYSGLYPILSINGAHNEFHEKAILDSNLWKTYQRQSMGGSISLPLTLSTGIWNQNLQLSSSIDYELTKDKKETQFHSKTTEVAPVSVNANYTIARQSNTTSLGARYLWSMNASYKTLPFKKHTWDKKQYTLGSQINLPGLFPSNVLSLSGAYSKQTGDSTYYFSTLNPVRGSTEASFDELVYLKSDYKFHLFNSDLAIGKFLYIKRATASLFADYSFGKLKNKHLEHLTYGPEVYFHLNPFSNKNLNFQIGGGWIFAKYKGDSGFNSLVKFGF